MDSYLGGLASKSDASSSVGAEGVVLLFFISNSEFEQPVDNSKILPWLLNFALIIDTVVA